MTGSTCSARRSTTRPARRSTRARACSGCRSRAARTSSVWPGRAIPRRSTSRPPGGVAGLDFSFSGLKTALLYRVRELGDDPPLEDLAASYQRAIVESLARRVERAVEATGLRRVALGGGVAANGPLRARITALEGVDVHVPPRELCTDNAAMIASAARYVPAQPFPAYLGLEAYASGTARP